MSEQPKSLIEQIAEAIEAAKQTQEKIREQFEKLSQKNQEPKE